MNIKRVLGWILLVGGITMILISNYIEKRVEEGKEQISSAEKKVDQGGRLFSSSPVTKELGQEVTRGAQKKIDSAKQKVGHYSELAGQLQIAGFVTAALGILIIFISRKKQKGQ